MKKSRAYLIVGVAGWLILKKQSKYSRRKTREYTQYAQHHAQPAHESHNAGHHGHARLRIRSHGLQEIDLQPFRRVLARYFARNLSRIPRRGRDSGQILRNLDAGEPLSMRPWLGWLGWLGHFTLIALLLFFIFLIIIIKIRKNLANLVKPKQE